jgi:hypothetical protein
MISIQKVPVWLQFEFYEINGRIQLEVICGDHAVDKIGFSSLTEAKLYAAEKWGYQNDDFSPMPTAEK